MKQRAWNLMMFFFTTFSLIQRYLILIHFLHFFLTLHFAHGPIGFPAGEGLPLTSEDGWLHSSSKQVYELRVFSLSAAFSFRLAVAIQGRALGLPQHSSACTHTLLLCTRGTLLSCSMSLQAASCSGQSRGGGTLHHPLILFTLHWSSGSPKSS